MHQQRVNFRCFVISCVTLLIDFFFCFKFCYKRSSKFGVGVSSFFDGKEDRTESNRITLTSIQKMDKMSIIRVILLFCLCCQLSTQLELDRSMRIVGGQTARVGQFPHAVALILYLAGSKSSFCGGSIIHPNFVLTVSIMIL